MPMGVLFWIGVFLGSLLILARSSEYFIRAAEKIGISLRMPAFIVGVTVVAIGTSLPELFSSIFAVLKGSSEIVVGDVIGSNIANIFFILGVSVVLGGSVKLLMPLIRVDLPILVGATLLMSMSIWDGVYSLTEAILSIFLLIIYLSYTISFHKKQKNRKLNRKINTDIRKEIEEQKRKIYLKNISVLILSLVFLYFSANYTVESVIALSEIFNIGTEIIALTVVAMGTSLPELFVSINAIRNKKAEIAVGNILGSTIFNSLGVMGIAALFGNLTIPNNLLNFSLPLMVIAALLYFFITQDKEITKWEGWLLIVFYVFFIAKILGIA